MSAPKDPTPMVAAAFTASLLLHAGALSLFAAADPRSTSLSLASRRTVETQLVLPPDAAPKAPAPEQQPAPPPPPPPQEEQPKPPPPQTEPDEVIAGIDDGIANTPAWLGFREATEHGGPKGVVEQSALSPQPGLPLPPGSPDPGQMDAPPLPPTPPSPPSEEPPAQPIKPIDSPPPQEPPAETVKPIDTPPPQEPPAEEKPQPETPPSPEQPVDQPVAPEQPDPEKTPAPLPEPQPAADQQPALIGPPQPAPDDDAAQTLEHATEGRDLATNANSPDPKSSSTPAAPEPDAVTQAQPDGILPLAADAQKQQPAEAAPKPIAPALAVPPAEVAPTLPTPPAPTPPRPKPRPAISPSAMLGVPNTGDGIGERSDAESDAAAINDALTIKPGKVAAHKGLRITTVRPEWSITTRLMTAPKNPVVRIVFGKDGKVKKAGFVRGQSTGYEEVDGPLLDALYRWTAKGESLDKLGNDRNAGVGMSFRIVLRSDPLGD